MSVEVGGVAEAGIKLTRKQRVLARIAADLDRLADALAAFDGDEDDLEEILDGVEAVADKARDAAFGAEEIPAEAAEAIAAGANPVAALRRARGLTQEALAQAAGFSTIYISKLERGEKPVREGTAEALALALRVWPENIVT